MIPVKVILLNKKDKIEANAKISDLITKIGLSLNSLFEKNVKIFLTSTLTSENMEEFLDYIHSKLQEKQEE